MKYTTCILSTLLFSPIIMSQTAPKAPKKDTILTKHGISRHDEYYWMNQRDSKDVLEYIAAENKVSEEFFTKNKKLQESLLDEFEKRINPNDVSAPYYVQGHCYQSRSVEGKDYQDIYRTGGKGEALFFSENERAKGKSYYDLGDWHLSTDGKILAFSEDHIGRRKYSIFFRDEKSKKILKDEIKNTDGSLIWANDNKTVFYVKKDEQTLREFQVYSHVIGTDAKNDKLIFEEKDEKYSVGISKTITGKYIVITSESSTTNEQLLINADKPEEAFKVFLPRTSGHLYYVEHHERGFYVLSNEKAKNNKIIFYKDFPTALTAHKEVIGHDAEVLIEAKLLLKNFLITATRYKGLQYLNVLNLSTNEKSTVPVDGETYTLSLAYNDNYQADYFYFSFNSMTTPTSVYQYNCTAKTQTLFFEKKLIDPNFSPTNYESKRVWATANDGTLIPISLVYKKGTDLSKAPLLLYGYGSYGVTIPPAFSATRLSLLDRGFVYALAQIRGGKDLGEDWYQNGKFKKKKNTFTDFINCAEYLGMKGYCDKNKIYAQGGSAGGLLMGAVTNMAPYLWKGVIAQVPFVDVVTTMLDESIPLTVGEYEEWGNPNEADYFEYMLSYSPYDQVKTMDYPNLLITTGYHDSQVQYWEPLKWIARLRDMRTNDNLLLLDCNMDAGHGGGSGRTSERKETAKVYSFILSLEGIAK